MNLQALPSPLPPEAFRRFDENPDQDFYAEPRFVTHIDEQAITAVTALYREFFTADSNLLDIMSSWISHLPSEVRYNSVTGLGMNEQELENNPRLDAYVVHDLNRNPEFPFEENQFDGAAICVSIDYLIRPVDVLRDLGRVMKPEAPLVITFSNRCFPTKAIAVWQMLDDKGHLDLVERFLLESGKWVDIEKRDCSPIPRRSDPLFAVIGKCKSSP